jgi:hypothetical protein
VAEPASEVAFIGDDGTPVAGDDSGGALNHGEVMRRVRHHRTDEGGGRGGISPAMAVGGGGGFKTSDFDDGF